MLILVILFFYFSTNSRDYTSVYNEKIQTATVESIIIALKLYNVHEIPYTKITPKIQIYIEENNLFVNSYYVEIIDGNINIKNGETKDEDIIIRTTKEEVLKIASDNTYITESLFSKRTTVEKATSDFILFTKGYSTLFWKNDITNQNSSA